MIRCQALFIFSLLPLGALFANMRAPIHVNRAGITLYAPKANLVLLGEKLIFDCPESFVGKHDYAKFIARVCRAKVQYSIRAPQATEVLLQFIYSGSKEVSWIYQGKKMVTVARTFTVAKSDLCNYCPDDFNTLQKVQQEIQFIKGESVLEIDYEQQLSYEERNLGYFSTSTWLQSFTYELWPIAEWQWGENPKAELVFSVKARDSFLGFGYKDDALQCQTIEGETKTLIPLTFSPVKSGKRTAVATVALRRAPLQLQCSYIAK